MGHHTVHIFRHINLLTNDSLSFYKLSYISVPAPIKGSEIPPDSSYICHVSVKQHSWIQNVLSCIGCVCRTVVAVKPPAFLAAEQYPGVAA